MSLTLPRLPNVRVTHWVAISRLVLALAIAWTLAQTTWLLWPSDGRVGAAPDTTPTRAAPATQSYRLQSVAELSLYGSAQSSGNSGVDAPQTQLNLTLRGVWANPAAKSGRAIIAGNGSEEAYKVGDSLPGGATLEQVFPDRVILKRGGKLEALYLPKEGPGGTYSAPVNMPAAYSAEPPGYPAPTDVGSRLQEYRQRIINDPQEVFSLARMQPVMEEGKLKGYKLSPNKEKELFREIGLRPGDVVMSVNGLALNDPAAAGQVMAQVSSASQLTLVVDRGGRPETIVVPIGK